jgi:hypothetical protein
MLKFFIELYVNIIDCYNHLAPDDKKADDVEESHSSHYIITICDPSTDPPIATYDKLFMETNLQEGYYSNEIDADADADAKMSTLTQTTTPSQQSQQSQHSQTSNKTRQTLEEINFQEPLMLTNMVIEDYYVVEDHDDEWELIEQRP